MGKSLFYYIGISWVTWYEVSAHWILLHSIPAQLRSCLLSELALPRRCRPRWSSLVSVRSSAGVDEHRFCSSEALPSPFLEPLQFFTAVLECGHPKQGSSSSVSGIKLNLPLTVHPIAVAPSVSPTAASRNITE